MALINRKKNLTKTTASLAPQPKLSSEEQFWTEVDQQARSLIANLLNHNLPLANEPAKPGLDLDRDRDYHDLFFEYETNYAEEAKLPMKTLTEEIAYEYLLMVIKSLSRNLASFNCHQAEYWEGLTD